MRSINKVAALLALSTMIFFQANAAEVDVSKNADAKKMDKLLQESGSKAMQCMMKQMQSGKSANETQAEAYCFCKNKPYLQTRLKQLEGIRAKHPEWNGQTLLIAAKDSKRMFGFQQIDEIKTSLGGAAKECK